MQTCLDIKLDSESRDSIYRQVSDCIAHAIRQGDLRPNDRLPTEEELARRLRVHRLTISRGYDLLREQGLVVRQRGRGTFVKPAGTGAEAEAKRNGISVAGFIWSPAESRATNTVDHFIREELRAGFAARLGRAGVVCELICMENLNQPVWNGGLARLDGALILSAHSAEPRCAWELIDRGVRAVIPFWPSALPGMVSVAYDVRKGTWLATQHLAQSGYRRIGFMGRGPSADEHPKFDGFAAALRENGLDLRAQDILETEGPFRPGEATTIIRRRLAQGPLPEALVAETDFVALEVLEALAFEGVRVPEDIAIAGYNNIPEGASSCPALTSVRPPYREIGEGAAETLLRWPKGGPAPKDVVLQPELVERESTRRKA
ncbi:MAG TPA: GntR family transcriptional regulator [Candidatus Brocadiia bacterium]|nr:GntR family transcriptional regulator [Candidatus Brocadiia bacterium]